jgi:pimeloyl-ACP methyl ester carboxylesterase
MGSQRAFTSVFITSTLSVALMGAGLTAAAATAPAKSQTSTISWGVCADADLASGGFECTTMKVPKDRAKKSGPTFTLALVRHRSTGTDAQRIGSLIFNPGGPGGSGSAAIGPVWDLIPSEVRERFDVVTWDPRGVAQSKPALDYESCPAPYVQTPKTGPINWSQVTDNFIDTIRTANESCVAKFGDDLNHMGTMEVVEDLERIRQAVGDEKLTYWGLSYGTRIGYVYALRYPNRVRAMVLDGSIDPASSILGLTEGGVGPDQAYGSWADVYPEAAAQWRQLLGALNKKTYVLGGRQVLDRPLALDFVYNFIAQQSGYPLITNVVGAWHAAVFGEGETREQGRKAGGDAIKALRGVPNSNAGSVFSLVNCLDYADRPTRNQVLNAVREQRRLAPRYGGQLSLMFGAGCFGMDVKPDPIPVITNSGSRVPVLILGSTRDGSTVVQWTARMSRAFPNSRTVTYAGGQHVTWGFAGSSCVNDIANEYVINVTLPVSDRGCPNVLTLQQ